jgi:hypothetical protein
MKGVSMNEPENKLKNFASGDSNYIKLPRGEDISCKYLSWEIVPSRFDGGKTECAQYHLEIEGQERIFSSKSKALARKISEIPEGTKIKIRIDGEGTKTKYFVEMISDNWE